MITIVTLLNRDDIRILRLADHLNKQTDKDFAWMIYDNSIDHKIPSIEKIKSEYDFNLSVIYGEPNVFGLVRRDALKNVSTDYSISVDADDWVSEDFIESFNNIIKHNDYDLIIGNKHEIIYEGHTESKVLNIDLSKPLSELYSFENWMIYWWGHAMKTEVLNQFVEDFLPLHVYEDYITLFDWTKYAKKVSVNYNGCYYYDRTTPSLSSASPWIKNVQALEKAIDNLKNVCKKEVGLPKVAGSLMYLKYKSLKTEDKQALDLIHKIELNEGLNNYKVPYEHVNYYRLKSMVDNIL
jgi:hypothetical protein